jgi:hypothetical protein
LDITAVLTKVIQGQQRTIEDLQARLQRLERKSSKDETAPSGVTGRGANRLNHDPRRSG